MKLKKVVAISLASLMAMSTLAACGNKQGAGAADGKISGTISHAYWDDGQTPYLQASVAKFKEIYPDVEIKLEPTAFAEYWNKLEAASTGGSSADVFWMNGPNIAKYAKGGVLLPIDDLLKNSSIDLSNYPEALLKLYNIDGKQYAIPKDFDTIGVWYNKKLFDEAGVPYPSDDWTWEDMVATAKQLTKADGSQYGISAQYRDQVGIYNTIFATGGYVLSEDKKTSGYSLPETQAGIQIWVDLIEAGVSPTQASLEETEDYVQFLSGKVAMNWNGSWFLNQIKVAENKDDFDVAALPSVNGKKATVIHGLGNCIAKSSKNQALAWKWVEFLAGEESNRISAETGAAIPTYKGTAKEWVEKSPEYNLSIFIDAAEKYAYPYPASVNTAEWLQYQGESLKSAFNLDIGVKEACDTIAEKMNEVLKNEQ